MGRGDRLNSSEFIIMIKDSEMILIVNDVTGWFKRKFNFNIISLHP